MEQQIIKIEKDRIRIFLILFFFSEEHDDSSNRNLKRLFESEVKLQKLDFWVRNPDYFCYSLLDIAERELKKKQEIKDIVRKIFEDREPEIRREDMRKFIYGAYEDMDNAIGFLDSVDLIKFDSKKDVVLRTKERKYYITDFGVSKIIANLPNLPFLKWYEDRCLLIKKYFGDKNGTQLKDIQYQVEAYTKTPYGQLIPNVSSLVKEKYNTIYQEKI
ncbi:hypothetical protein ACFO3O_12785 [Dokdonia ponticola]|uniref:Bro-N domain-containing protein n=1 Tax=Dokdonia ponticola TaxID=2041041 RepID=A0ABV9I0K2_9FLAO